MLDKVIISRRTLGDVNNSQLRREEILILLRENNGTHGPITTADRFTDFTVMQGCRDKDECFCHAFWADLRHCANPSMELSIAVEIDKVEDCPEAVNLGERGVSGIRRATWAIYTHRIFGQILEN